MMINLEVLRLWCMAILFVIVSLLGSKVSFAQDKAEAKAQQDDFCSNWNYGDKNQFSEVREFTVPSSGTVTVDGGTNGGVSVIGEDRNDVFIRACVQAWGKTAEEGQALAKGISIQTGSVIRADNPNNTHSWGVSYRISVPRNTNLKLTTHNGGIKISSVSGTMEFEAMNGGLKLSGLSGSVRGRTSNGGIKIDLAGTTWKGTGLDLQTTNGGVKVRMPENYAAHIETGTVNGGFKSEITGIQVPDDGQRNRGRTATRISTDINGGGPPIRIVTTNGGVMISSVNDKE